MVWFDESLMCASLLIDTGRMLQRAGPDITIQGWESVDALLAYLDTVMCGELRAFLQSAGATVAGGTTTRPEEVVEKLLGDYRKKCPFCDDGGDSE